MNWKERNERNMKIVAQYNSGKTMIEIGREFGLTQANIHRILKDGGCARRRRGRVGPVKPDQNAKVQELRCQGMTGEEIALELGISISAVKSTIYRTGVQTDAWKAPVKRQPLIKPLWESGMGLIDIARDVGLGVDSVRNTLRTLGVTSSEIKARRINALKSGGRINAMGGRIREMHESGMTQSQIAAELGMPRTSIATFCQRNGLKGVGPFGRPKREPNTPEGGLK